MWRSTHCTFPNARPMCVFHMWRCWNVDDFQKPGCPVVNGSLHAETLCFLPRPEVATEKRWRRKMCGRLVPVCVCLPVGGCVGADVQLSIKNTLSNMKIKHALVTLNSQANFIQSVLLECPVWVYSEMFELFEWNLLQTWMKLLNKTEFVKCFFWHSVSLCNLYSTAELNFHSWNYYYSFWSTLCLLRTEW